MRLIRFGPNGQERPGLLSAKGVVDLRAVHPDIPDINQRFFSEGWLERVRPLAKEGQKMDVRFGPPVSRPSKIICLGKNYAEHAREGGFQPPETPLLFCKTPNTLNGPRDPIVLPRSCGQIDWEVELAVIIGKTAKRIGQREALDIIAGVTVMNDVSGREAQFSDSQWFRGKSFDTFAPMGPALVTLDEIGDLHSLRLSARVNGRLMQDGRTADMIFDIPTLLAFISADITLTPGDVVSTGTPSGVGIFRDPPVLLQAGDVVECWIEGIGSLVNPVVAD
jgi:2-keto-4-pentenoate hydratase/2-oxohepta-3-ene-1,7-dioic acid hydratase in catechol pathway